MDTTAQNSSPEPISVTNDSQIEKLEKLVQKTILPNDLRDNLKAMIGRLKIIKTDANFYAEYDTISRYINWVCYLPWNRITEDMLDLNHAKQILDKNHFGLNEVKEKILEYLAIMIMAKTRMGERGKEFHAKAPILSLVGLAGVGKTTIAYSIAEALGRRIVRIPFGGLGSAAQLRGKSRLSPDSEPGLVIKALKQAGVKNPVILLDEIDRVSQEARADIMGVLVELLDPNQNKAFVDHFIDFPVDLSQVLFVATSNNTKDISTAVIDRLEVIQMPSYTDQEKTVIAKTYTLPQALVESGLTEKDFIIDEGVWEEFIIRPLGYDPGIRSVQRVIQGIVRKVVYYMLMGQITQGQQFVLNKENAKQFVPQW